MLRAMTLRYAHLPQTARRRARPRRFEKKPCGPYEMIRCRRASRASECPIATTRPDLCKRERSAVVSSAGLVPGEAARPCPKTALPNGPIRPKRRLAKLGRSHRAPTERRPSIPTVGLKPMLLVHNVSERLAAGEPAAVVDDQVSPPLRGMRSNGRAVRSEQHSWRGPQGMAGRQWLRLEDV